MDEEVTEEDAADVAARKQTAARAREEAELRQRSQVRSVIGPLGTLKQGGASAPRPE